jgi:hypothetical protein
LSGIFLKNQKDCGQAAMTESDNDNDVALLMNSLVYPMSLGHYRFSSGNHKRSEIKGYDTIFKLRP